MTPSQKRQRTILRKKDFELRRACISPYASKETVDRYCKFEVRYGDLLRELEDLYDALAAESG